MPPPRRPHASQSVTKPTTNSAKPIALTLVALALVAATYLFAVRQTPLPASSGDVTAHEERVSTKPQAPVASPEIAGIARVVDGDTLAIHRVRIRLHGIDAPESRQLCMENGRPWRCGLAATQQLRDLIGNSPVTCIPLGKDTYGRTIAQCRVRNVDIGGWLTDNGWAVAYTRFSDMYVNNEARARASGKGMMRGDVELPEEWRRRH